MEGVSDLLVLDLSQLRNITLNDEALMREVVSALVNDVSQRIEELRRAVGRRDSQACIKLAHNAQGACGNVGAAAMASLFSSLERQAAGSEMDACGGSLQELAVELEKLRREAESI